MHVHFTLNSVDVGWDQLALERWPTLCDVVWRAMVGLRPKRLVPPYDASILHLHRDRHDDLIEAHAQRMATPEAKQKYAARRHRGERPFAQIKHHFGARQFLLRGLKKVRIEWTWLVSAFNIRTLMPLIQARPSPDPETIIAAP